MKVWLFYFHEALQLFVAMIRIVCETVKAKDI